MGQVYCPKTKTAQTTYQNIQKSKPNDLVNDVDEMLYSHWPNILDVDKILHSYWTIFLSDVAAVRELVLVLLVLV